MSKAYKGYELIKEIAEGNIKERNLYRNTRLFSNRQSSNNNIIHE